MVFGEKELYYLLVEIRDNLGFIRIMNAWSRFAYSVNLAAMELCINKPNSKTELTDEIAKSRNYLRSKPSRPLRENEVNWFLFRSLAPYTQRVLDLLIYGCSTTRIIEVMLNVTSTGEEIELSEHMIEAIIHFNNLHSIVDKLNFNNVLSFKEQEIKLSLHSNERLEKLYL